MKIVCPRCQVDLGEIEPEIRLACDSHRCGWKGSSNGVLRASDPFNEGSELLACPQCREQTIRTCCDEPGCWEQDTCGTPTPSGYRRTCGKHLPSEKHTVTQDVTHRFCPTCAPIYRAEVEKELAEMRKEKNEA